MSGAHTMAGVIGLMLSIPLWLLTSWRLSFHFNGGSSRWTLRRRFHVLLWCATLSEAIAYADFAGLVAPIFGRAFSDKIGYILLDLAGRSIFEFLAFSSVTELWLQTSLQASPTTISRHYHQRSLLIRTLNRVLGGVSVLMSGILIVYLLLLTTGEPIEKIEKSELLFRIQILMESLAWAVGAAFVLMCIQITKERIQISFATFPPADEAERINLQVQALAPMVVCASCYGLRAFFLFCRLVGAESAVFVATMRFHPVWWLFFVWAPTLLVVAAALYAARRRDRSALLDGGGGDPLLPDNHIPLLGQLGQPSVPPPAAAFQNFRRFAEGITTPSPSVGPSSPVKTPQQSNDDDNNNNHQTSPLRTLDASSNLGDFTVV
ncbi:expressed unknown protein [Seminavis robusta]|uniref:Transmembrane protein n=1 Tax=Seminavis robusta TaxID=568900 RepID=A0A9N8DL81_9STRA|nr:expressed unknown protein [Seminavis robusta]|eukprot:Sro216_g089340.1 n/a (378) ;mRNA; f:35576-36802